MTRDFQAEERAVVVGLQKQLNELFDIVHQMKTGASQAEGGEQRQEVDDRSEAKQHEEIKKLNVRITHLLRALENKDRTIEKLQAALESKH
ncbi:hypothetical protein FB645_004522 [Coemansia sp. IMI 203386]|nr:hypothetical protein GGF39_000332 [Coemansia sp. RSA 1721]KAJ2701849.1 hypothetical protein FB645_004522 [Coemansia sp. IMI 203386]